VSRFFGETAIRLRVNISPDKNRSFAVAKVLEVLPVPRPGGKVTLTGAAMEQAKCPPQILQGVKHGYQET
jgi:hypothetical protein